MSLLKDLWGGGGEGAEGLRKVLVSNFIVAFVGGTLDVTFVGVLAIDVGCLDGILTL